MTTELSSRAGAVAGQHESMLDLMIARAETAAERGVTFFDSPDAFQRLTYRDLDRRARRGAARLRRAGYRPGDRALLIFEPGLEFVCAVYTAIYAGLTVVTAPLTFARSHETMYRRVLRVGSDSKSQLVLTTREIGDEVEKVGSPARIHHILLDDPPDEEADNWEHPGTRAGDLAILQYTSGSVGLPKGVCVTHRNLLANHAAVAALIDPALEHTIVGWLPHYHDMGLTLYIASIVGGYDFVGTSPRQFLQRPAFWLELITRFRGTTTAAPDFAYSLCARLVTDEQASSLDLSSLRVAITGAEPVKVKTLEQFESRFVPRGFDQHASMPAYGMAEVTVLAAAKRAQVPLNVLNVDAEALEHGTVALVDEGVQRATKVVSCGPPALGCHIVIVDPVTLVKLGSGQVGEIWISGESVTDGYWQRPDETAEAFGGRLVGEPDLYLRTGDLGFLQDGELVVTGRIKDLIILHGRNIYPTDLEDVASREASHGESVSVAFEGPEQSVVAVVEWNGEPVTASEMAARVRQELHREFSLGRVRVVLTCRGGIPRTTSGKVQRSLTREALAKGSLTVLHDTEAPVSGQAGDVDDKP